jgi:3-hydroxyacyl-[acyl-carrier-protein] dehydratase
MGQGSVPGPTELDAAAIMQVLPHRPPFLFVDRVAITAPGRSAKGWKAVGGNEPYLAGHFPGRPVFPGVLILEAMAQVGGVALLSLPEFQGRLALLGGVEQARFRRPVGVGDTLCLEVEVTRRLGRVGKAHGVASVQGERVAEADLTFAVAAT